MAWFVLNIAYRNPIRFLNVLTIINKDDADIILHSFGLYGFKKTNISVFDWFYVFGFTGISLKSNYDGSFFRNAVYFGFAPIALGPF